MATRRIRGSTGRKPPSPPGSPVGSSGPVDSIPTLGTGDETQETVGSVGSARKSRKMSSSKSPATRRKKNPLGPEEQMVEQVRLAMPKAFFLRNHRWHHHRRWEMDLAFLSERVGVEVQGGTWLGRKGGHTSPLGYAKDREKNNEAQLLGWIVLEVTTNQVRSGQALQWIERALSLRATTC